MKLPNAEAYIARGIKMEKEISHSFFGSVTDERVAYSLKEASELTRQGFKMLIEQNAGWNLARNILLDLQNIELPS